MSEEKGCIICFESLENHYISSDYFIYLYTQNVDILVVMNQFVQCTTCVSGQYCIPCLMISLTSLNACPICKTVILGQSQESINTWETIDDYDDEYDDESDSNYLNESIEELFDQDHNPAEYQGAQQSQESLVELWNNNNEQQLSCQLCFQPKKLYNICNSYHFSCMDCIIVLDKQHEDLIYNDYLNYDMNAMPDVLFCRKCPICDVTIYNCDSSDCSFVNQTGKIDVEYHHDEIDGGIYVIKITDFSPDGRVFSVQTAKLVLDQSKNVCDYYYQQRCVETALGAFICNLVDIQNVDIKELGRLFKNSDIDMEGSFLFVSPAQCFYIMNHIYE